MNKKFLIIFLILITTNAVGKIYQCDFSSDKLRYGKPNKISSFGIYIPNISHGKSILFANSTTDNSTWTELRFGHCENENT